MPMAARTCKELQNVFVRFTSGSQPPYALRCTINDGDPEPGFPVRQLLFP